MRITRRLALGGLLAAPALQFARAAEQPATKLEKVTYLFPAPSFLPAFIPHHLAQSRGYFKAEGLDVSFEVGRGGADVAKQVAVGNADVGGGVGETSMIVRPNGLKVRGVALLGGRPIFQVAARKAANIHDWADLRGKKIGVIGYEDTSYYSLLGALAAKGLKRNDLQIEAVGNAGMTQLMIAKSLDAIMATPDWAYAIESAGVPLVYFPIYKIFPAMAQAVLASDDIVKRRPKVVRGVVHAILHGVLDCMKDPASAARDFIAAVPQQKGMDVAIEAILRRYDSQCYRTDPPQDLGLFDPKRLSTVQHFYLKNKIIRSAVPVEDLYTNEFVH